MMCLSLYELVLAAISRVAVLLLQKALVIYYSRSMVFLEIPLTREISMSQNPEISYEERTVQGSGGERVVHRAVIRFMPGPHGTVLTEDYMGREGAEITANNLQAYMIGLMMDFAKEQKNS
jgi:hypothetical protein